MKDVTFGQYYPANSFVHKMDARVKILIVIAYIVAVFLVKSFHFLGFCACLAFVIIATILAKVPFSKALILKKKCLLVLPQKKRLVLSLGYNIWPQII